MSDRLEDTTTQEAAEAASETETTEVEAPATSCDKSPENEAAPAESEPAEEGSEAAGHTSEAVAEPESKASTTADSSEEDKAAEIAAKAEPEAESEGAEAEAAAAPESQAETETATAAVAAEAETPAEAEAPVETEATVETAEETAASEAEAAAETSADAKEDATSEAAAAPEPDSTAESAETSGSAEAEAEAASAEAETKTEAEAGIDAAKETAAVETTEADASAEAQAADSKADTSEAMAELEAAMKEKKTVKGQVIGWNKGGYHVAIGKIAAFCPVSQIEIGNPRGPKRYLDKTFTFRVIEIQNGGRRVVLSRSGAIKAERERKAALVRDLLQEGAELEGKVSSLTNFGAFVDLGGGIEGLVHVSEISRKRVEHPKEALRSGQKVKVRVLKIEKGGQRISLSIKRLEPDPWKGVAERFPVGSEFKGTILRQTEFGLFVEVEPGLEGLVHTSRLAIGTSLNDESLEVGKEVSGWIHEVEAKRRRLSLSFRELGSGNPWQGISDRYPVGDLIKGTVERLASFGAFIELEPGLTGLLPFSVLGASGGNPRRQYHVGKEVSVRVLSIDRDKRRISLGTETSKAEGNQQDYREYMKTQSRSKKDAPSGLNAMAAAFAKLKEQQPPQEQ